MRELGATSISAFGVSVEFPPSATEVAGKYSTLKIGSKCDEEDADDELDGIPMPPTDNTAAWLAQKAKQDAQSDTAAAPQPDLMDWYTARPLPSVD